jgi:hypothetical protein
LPTAHFEATTKAKILQWDIFVGNIFITCDGNGILIDWELYKDQTTEARVKERTVCHFIPLVIDILWTSGYVVIRLSKAA